MKGVSRRRTKDPHRRDSRREQNPERVFGVVLGREQSRSVPSRSPALSGVSCSWLFGNNASNNACFLPTWSGEIARQRLNAMAKRAVPATATDEEIRVLLEHYRCPVPFHEVRARFLGNIATPAVGVSPIKMVERLWSGELPEFNSIDAANELIGALIMGLWNRLTRHQERSAPFRLVPRCHGHARRPGDSGDDTMSGTRRIRRRAIRRRGNHWPP